MLVFVKAWDQLDGANFVHHVGKIMNLRNVMEKQCIGKRENIAHQCAALTMPLFASDPLWVEIL